MFMSKLHFETRGHKIFSSNMFLMVGQFLALVLCLGGGTQSQEPDRDSIMKRLDDLVDYRMHLDSMLVVAIAEDPSYTIRFTTKILGKLIRTDREYLAFNANQSQVGDRDKVVVRDGKLLRKHSVYGAKLEISNSPFNTQVNVRLLGLSPSPISGLEPDTPVSRTLVGQIASELVIATFAKESFQSLDCLSLSVIRKDNATMKAFFDLELRYRGCSIQSGEYFDWVFIEEMDDKFPKSLHVNMTKSGSDVFNEKVIVDRVALGGKIEETEFEWRGLGVEEGELVEVRDGSLGSGIVKGVLRNGNLVPASKDEIAKTPTRPDSFRLETSYPRQMIFWLGSCLLLFASIAVLLLLRPKSK
jgi:hypothetical protein